MWNHRLLNTTCTLAESWSCWDLSYHVRLGLFSSCLKDIKIIESISVESSWPTCRSVSSIIWILDKCQWHYGCVIKFLLKLPHTVAPLPLSICSCWGRHAEMPNTGQGKSHWRRLKGNLVIPGNIQHLPAVSAKVGPWANISASPTKWAS